MTVRIAINGMGRIGRAIVRALVEYNRSDVELVAMNGTGSIEDQIHLLKYDSVHGPFLCVEKVGDKIIALNGKHVHICQERDPKKLPWADLNIDIVLECTGRFTNYEEASVHIESAGAKKVIISAPAEGAEATIIYGVNHTRLKAEHTIISIGSCTTNCLAPVVAPLHRDIGIRTGYMTTIHAYTNDQNILDGSHRDLRRARACALSMIPTTTGAAKSLGKVIPALAGKIDGTAIRVPVPNVSMVDLSFISERTTTREEINNIMQKEAASIVKGALTLCTEPLVSIDFNHNPFSSIFDVTQTQVMDGNLCRVVAWYDNEWAFSVRMLDIAVLWHGLKAFP